ncbi:MAG: c-type cytochrome biogenesis protein CcsB [Actinomycetales bacterium]|nr:c-type cytochrome biogenesis protein CcsB [Actinomycetales bacterium]
MNDQMGDLSTALVYAAMAAYMVAMVAFAVDVSALGTGTGRDRPRRAAGIAVATTWLGAGLHLVGIVTRGLAAGRAPWANMYEFTLMFTFFAVAIFLGIQTSRDVRYVGVLVTLLALLGLGLAVSVLFVRADGVQPALNSYWLLIHVSVATLSTGVLSISAMFSVLQLLKARHARVPQRSDPVAVGAGGASAELVDDRAEVLDDRAEVLDDRARVPAERAARDVGASPEQETFVGRLMASLPSSENLERLAYRLNAIGFVTWTFTLVAGAIWAEHAWGRPWGWDPKETWTFVVWVIYAAYLHARVTAGWAAERFAYFALVGFVAVLANFYVVNVFFSGKHSYAGI